MRFQFLHLLLLHHATAILFRIENFEQCPKVKVPNIIKNVVISQEGLDTIKVDIDIEIGRVIQEPATPSVKIYKCPSKENRDLCEYFTTIKMNSFCDDLSKKKGPWMANWKYSSLPTNCPIPKGNYSMKGAEIKFPSGFIFSVFAEGYWKVRSVGVTNGQMWHCVVIEMSLFSSKRKQRRKH